MARMGTGSAKEVVQASLDLWQEFSKGKWLLPKGKGRGRIQHSTYMSGSEGDILYESMYRRCTCHRQSKQNMQRHHGQPKTQSSYECQHRTHVHRSWLKLLKAAHGWHGYLGRPGCRMRYVPSRYTHSPTQCPRACGPDGRLELQPHHLDRSALHSSPPHTLLAHALDMGHKNQINDLVANMEQPLPREFSCQATINLSCY
jgi:hypothetical protein